MVSEPEPQRLREAARGVAHEWMAYWRVARAMTREPRRFMQQWADGERAALNPLACLLNAVAVQALCGVAWQTLRHTPDSGLPPWLEVLTPAAAMLNWAIVASLIHFPLKLLAPTRRWRTTLAAVMYVFAGPLLPFYIVRDCYLAGKLKQPPPSIAYVGLVIGAVLTTYLALALAGAHRTTWWRVVLAFVLGIVVLLLVGLALKRVIA
jgi:hypothetical protein